MKILILFAIISAAVTSSSAQLFPNGLSPLLARDFSAPEAPASTVHASHVAGLTPALYYAAPYPYYAYRYAAPTEYYSYKYAY